MSILTDNHRHILLWILASTIYLLLPIGINFIVSLNTPQWANVVGDENTWINFWAVYISGIIPFIILFLTLNNNNVQNRENRRLQSNSLSYQLYLAHVAEYKSAIISILSIINRSTIDDFIKIIHFGDFSKRERYLENVFSKINEATNNFRITFSTNLDEIEQKFLSEFEDIRYIFSDILRDISWISYQGLQDSLGRSLEDEFQVKLKKYKTETASTVRSNSHRIWVVIQDFDIKDDKFHQSIIERLASFDISGLFYDKSMNFIKYENNKANKILYGPEQDK